MDEKMREKMVTAIQNAVLVAGAKDYEEGMRQARKLIEFAHNGIQATQTIDGLRTMLDSCEPMSKGEEKVALLAIKLLPQVLRIGLKMAAKKAETTLPALPGGRPRAVTADEAEKVQNFISELERKGSTHKVAQYRASMRFGLSERTIQRIWSERKSPREDEPTMGDVLRYISTGE